VARADSAFRLSWHDRWGGPRQVKPGRKLRRRSRIAPILRAVQAATFTVLQGRRPIRRESYHLGRRPRPVWLLAGLILLALLAAHASHVPVLAHDEPTVVGEMIDGHHLSVVHTEHPAPLPPNASELDSVLANRADHRVECVAELATMPTPMLVPGSLPAPTSIAREVTAALSSARGALFILPEPARRHLLFQVLLR
jgi:hypothetical protein